MTKPYDSAVNGGTGLIHKARRHPFRILCGVATIDFPRTTNRWKKVTCKDCLRVQPKKE